MQPGPNAWTTRQIVRVFLTLAVLALLLYLVYRVRSVLELVLVAGFLAIALGPPVEFLVRRHIRRGIAIVLVYLGIVAAIFGVGLVIIPPVVDQVNGLSKDIPGYVQDLRKSKTFRKYDDKYDISKKLNEQAAKLPSRLGEAAGTLQDITVGVFGALVKLVTVLTMTFFLLLDGGKILRFFLGMRGPAEEERLRVVFEGIYRSVAGYVAGNLLISFIAGGVTYVTLRILGVPFAAPLAVLMGFLDLIPLVGATIGGIVIGAVTAFTDFPTATIVWVIVLIVYQQIENNVLQPVVYRRTVQVAPLLTIVAILIGSTLLGVLGVLVAIPVAGAIQIVVRDIWNRREPAIAIVEQPGTS
ncbi:MAG: AI-2E family transporter [Actinobacteria bacterium]|nr:MAG: AI-2E family transporter [Actinomycetota bacterium]